MNVSIEKKTRGRRGKIVATVALSGLLVLGQGALGVGSASATGWTSRSCFDTGGGTVEGFSAPGYAYTNVLILPCHDSQVGVKNYFQVYPGGPYMWTGASYAGISAAGGGFVRINQTGTVKARHYRGVYYFDGP